MAERPKKQQTLQPEPRSTTPLAKLRQSSAMRNSGSTSPNAVRRTRTKPVGFFTGQGGTGKRSANKDAI